MFKRENIRSLEEIEAEKATNEFRGKRLEAMAKPAVTTKAGNTFDANEAAINRMTQRLLALSDKDDKFKVEWSLANTPTGHKTVITKAELAEAQRLASDLMSSNWFRN